jgi:hypothetical protein
MFYVFQGYKRHIRFCTGLLEEEEDFDIDNPDDPIKVAPPVSKPVASTSKVFPAPPRPRIKPKTVDNAAQTSTNNLREKMKGKEH